MIEKINPIESTYRFLIARGRNIQKLFVGLPNEQGFIFPGEILDSIYSSYFKHQTYSPHPKGLLSAREAISSYYSQHDFHTKPENIILTAGTSESFFYLFSLLTRPGENILCPNPSYPLFDHLADLRGIELKPYRLYENQNWSVCIDDLTTQANEKTRALILISPHNPTGSIIPGDQLCEIIDWANKKDLPVICDEVFSEFVFGGKKYPRAAAVAKPKLCFTLNGISKMFALPAMKLGWIAVTGQSSSVEISVDKLETTVDTFLPVHQPIQEALPKLFTEGRNFVETYRREVEARSQLAVNMLKESPWFRFTHPQGGFYLTFEMAKETKLTEEEFVIRLMEEEGIFIHPGYFYDYERGIHLVLSFLTRPDLLREGIKSLIRFADRL